MALTSHDGFLPLFLPPLISTANHPYFLASFFWKPGLATHAIAWEAWTLLSSALLLWALHTPHALSWRISRAKTGATTRNTVISLNQAIEQNNAIAQQLNMVECSFWSQETSTDWWDRIVMQLWDDKQWLQNFWMRKATFQELCAELLPALKCSNTKMRPALTVEKSCDHSVEACNARLLLVSRESIWSSYIHSGSCCDPSLQGH